MNVKNLRVKAQAGFTLIELMIVVAIVGILAAVAIPQYSDYVTRAKWVENISGIEQLKLAIAECAQDHNGDLATCVYDETDISNLAPYGVGAAVVVGKGTVAAPVGAPAGTAVFEVTGDGAEVNDCSFTFGGTTNASTVSWDILSNGGATLTAADCAKFVKGSHA